MVFGNIFKLSSFLLVPVVLFSAFTADGQTRTKRKSRTLMTSQVQPAPTTEPEIISRAEDYRLDTPVVSPAVESAMRTIDETSNATEKLIADLNDRIRVLESNKKDDYDQKQKRLALNLDILSKAEQRAESLRKQAFDMMERETVIKSKIEQIENDLRPENIDRNFAFIGSLRPEEAKDARKKSLEAEKLIQQNLLTEVQRTRATLDLNVQKADLLVERLRVRLEADIDAALDDDPQRP